MKTTLEEINSVQRRIKIVVPAEEVDSMLDAGYRAIQQRVKVDGFRAGKAPLGVIRRHYQERVVQDTAQRLVQETLPAALTEHHLAPIGRPLVEPEDLPAAAQDFTFSAVVDIMPAIELTGKHRGLNLTCHAHELTEPELNMELKGLARSKGKAEPLLHPETPAAEGHLATISHRVFQDGQEVETMAVNRMPVALGREELLPDLEAGILGMVAGGQKELTITLGSDYPDERFAGRTLDFHLTLDELQRFTVPELDDAFAKELGAESLANLREQMEQQLRSQKASAESRELEQGALAAMRREISIEAPPSLVDRVVDAMISDAIKDKAQQQTAMADAELRKRLRPDARVQVQNTLLIEAVIREESLAVTDEEIRSHLSGMLPEGQEDQLERFLESVGGKVRQNLLTGKAMKLIIDSARLNRLPPETAKNPS